MRLHMFGMGILSGRRLHFLVAFFIGIIHLCIIFFQQYSVMCEYYCDAVCMQNSNKEEKKITQFSS